MSKGIRTFHRWTSAAFTLAVATYSVVMIVGGGQPAPAWMNVAVLLPLMLLLATGIYLFVLPYLPRRRGAEAR